MKSTILIVCTLLLAHLAQGQVRQRKSELNRLVPPATRLTGAQQQEAAKIFEKVTEGLKTSSSSSVSRLFDRTVRLALPGIEQGQYSHDQAAQLLSTYLRSAKTLSFRVKKQEDSLASPYLSATIQLLAGDQEQQLRLYVSLNRSADSWKIGHLSVY